jgi:hypothetical protein
LSRLACKALAIETRKPAEAGYENNEMAHVHQLKAGGKQK